MTADILEYGMPVDVKPPAEGATIEEAEFDRLTGG
jgi:tryptophan synthase alpha subunit